MPQRKERISLVCEECGITYERLACQLTKSTHTYCSLACVGKAKQHGSLLYCALCDSPFYRRFGEQDLGQKRMQFCSRPCYMEWRDLHRSPNTYPRIGQVHKHRIVVEAVLGRALLPDEVVHHIDCNKQNYHPSNLAVFPNQSYHARCHMGGMSDAELSGFSLQQADSG